MERERGSDAVIEKIVKMGHRMSVAEMAKLSEMVTSAGGTLVAVDAGDDWCGTGRLRIPWPPKKDEFHRLLDHLVQSRINFEVLINGIPVPEEILINASRRVGW